jgi:RHS repeat-associated protein
MPGRKYSATTATTYRFGFNGKEDDKDINIGVQDYGMRIYSERLGRFLSVDPLTKEYPWFTPYQFAANKPINSIDLDGAEELEITGIVLPTGGQPGSATLTISINYHIVTQGIGAVTDFQKINVNAIREKFSNGDGNFRMRNLPTATTEAVFLTRKENRIARRAEKGRSRAIEKLKTMGITYYNTNVVYNVTLVNNPNFTLEDAQVLEKANPRLNGVIISVLPLNTDLCDPLYTEANNDAFAAFDRHAKKAAAAPEGEVGSAEGYGLTFDHLSENRELNLVIFNPLSNKNGYTTNTTHEIGHNITNKSHTPDYQYDQNGLQSNDSPSPSSTNTKTIINNLQNRSGIIRR